MVGLLERILRNPVLGRWAKANDAAGAEIFADPEKLFRYSAIFSKADINGSGVCSSVAAVSSARYSLLLKIAFRTRGTNGR